jgi:8-oxo-dGTP pyrophosphatase MutT (NUDIX family)
MSDRIHVRAGLIVVRDGRILLVPHFDTDRGPLQFNIPGGAVEFGETLVEAAIREFREETGYEASCDGLLDIYEHRLPDWHSITVGFRGTITGGEMRSEMTRWGERTPRWLTADELREYPYHPAPLIEKAFGI